MKSLFTYGNCGKEEPINSIIKHEFEIENNPGYPNCKCRNCPFTLFDIGESTYYVKDTTEELHVTYFSTKKEIMEKLSEGKL